MNKEISYRKKGKEYCQLVELENQITFIMNHQKLLFISMTK